ncbi:MAG: polysaccharide deacetylase family protein [Planctomycetota bacterium]
MKPPAPPKPPRLAITVDVEADWCGVDTRGIDEMLPRLLERLDRHATPATFFVVGQHAARFRRHVAPHDRHEVGSHSQQHRVLTRLDNHHLQRELVESKQALEALGYDVHGFRAPFLRTPAGLLRQLDAAGYRYDSSLGSVVPGPQNLYAAWRYGLGKSLIQRVGPSLLRDRVTPYSLTWLRLYGRLGRALLPRGDAVFYCHLHEFLPASRGVAGWPAPVRWLHRRRVGDAAWRILDGLLTQPHRFVTCRQMLADRAPLP